MLPPGDFDDDDDDDAVAADDDDDVDSLVARSTRWGFLYCHRAAL